MGLSNMEVFSNFVYGSATETIRQQIELFNEASGGALSLATVRNVGDFSHEVTYQAIANLVRRRDAYGSGSLNASSMGQLDHVAVKIAGGTYPVQVTPAQFSWIQRNQEEAGVVFGEQLAKGIMADEVNTAVLGLVAALSGNAAVNHDATAGNLTLNALNRGAAKFGDRSMDLVTWIVHGKPMHDLFDNAISNANRLFEFGNLRIIQDGFGRRFVMTDSPALYEEDGVGVGTDAYHTLGLVNGGVTVEDNDDYYGTVQEKTGDENIQRVFQAEYTFNLGIKGYSWNTSLKSPNDAAIGTPGNWTKIATSDKDTAGVLVTSQ